MKAISKAILEAQKEMGNATKESTNPFFKSKYADLNAIREACMPVLHKHGISVLQPTAFIDGKNFVKTLLLHESGESMECLTEIIFGKLNDAQAQGSGITYARRYGLQSFLNIGADDDDGNKASKPDTKIEDNSQWIAELNKCKTPEDLLSLYNSNKEALKNAAIKALFTKRKIELDAK